MSDALNITLNGLNASASRIAKAASSIVNASSTGEDGKISSGLIDIAKEKNNYAAEAKVIRVAQETNKSLLDILV